MKILFRATGFLATCIFLIGCNEAVTASPLSTLTATVTLAITPSSSNTPTAAVTPTSRPEYVPPTLIPNIDPTLAPQLLSKAFSTETVEDINGHKIKKITGWDYGFRRSCHGFQWLDSDHIMLFPSTGQYDTPNFGTFDNTVSVVINLDTGNTWLPSYEPSWDCDSAPFSLELGTLVLSHGENTFISDLDGNMINEYTGKLVGVSTSGSKILIDDNTWIDLKSGKKVKFKWSEESEAEQYLYFPRPLWSSDEMQVYTCCYQYGNARTGESFRFPYDDLSLDGKKATGALFHSYGEWILNDSYLLIQWDFFYDSNPGFIPLFDPKVRTLRNLNILAGIPTDFQGIPNCQMAFAAPGGKSIWATCYSGDYLINVPTFRSVEFPTNNSYEYPNWSASGDFAWMETEPPQLLSVSSKQLGSLPIDPLYDSEPQWHPTESILAYLSKDGKKLQLLNAQTLSIQEIALPTSFRYLIWSPSGDYVALIAEDGSLWELDYLSLKQPEQITLPLPKRVFLKSVCSQFQHAADAGDVNNGFTGRDGMFKVTG